jgi:hypothetical protein
MGTQIEFLEDLSAKISTIKNDIEKNFYYLESEDLLFKSDPKKWNIVEVFEHLNLAHEHYIKELRDALKGAPDSDKVDFKMSWLGKKMVGSMKPDGEKIPFKMKTFKKTDPLVAQSNGKRLVEHVVFQDFVQGLIQFEEIIALAKTKNIQKIKIPSLIAILKLKVGDALAFVLAHMERHLLQAYQISNQK